MSKTIIAGGGGGFQMDTKNPLLDLYILAQTQKKNPKVCFLPTASGDNPGLINYFKTVFETYPCQTYCLDIINPVIADFDGFLSEMDAIYVGGGNSKSMLGLWREWGVDQALKNAYEQRTVLAGVSAGSVCWFEFAVSDYSPDKFSVLPCLGFLKGSNCPHYHSDKGRPAAYHRFLKSQEIPPGYAADDGAAFHFENGELLRTVSSRSYAKGYRLSLSEDKQVIEKAIKPEFLGDDEVLSKYIVSSATFA